MEQITRHATAGAKINLFLSIGARRADGYHELDTVMQSLPFGDAVSLYNKPSLWRGREKSRRDRRARILPRGGHFRLSGNFAD